MLWIVSSDYPLRKKRSIIMVQFGLQLTEVKCKGFFWLDWLFICANSDCIEWWYKGTQISIYLTTMRKWYIIMSSLMDQHMSLKGWSSIYNIRITILTPVLDAGPKIIISIVQHADGLLHQSSRSQKLQLRTQSLLTSRVVDPQLLIPRTAIASVSPKIQSCVDHDMDASSWLNNTSV